ncbi:uncharacterized protein [Watersipora subatra]|uniref:uncharacterized protein n=1 Tax=Watersipora subatra TaxID=2589382 RepID=UPI00355C0F26
MAIRLITKVHSQNHPFVSTLCKGGILRYPQFIAIDSSTNLYVTVQDGIVKVPAGTNVPEALTSLKGGFIDGPVSLARFYNPIQVTVLSDSLLAVVDSGNRRIRLVDLYEKNVTTLIQLSSKMLHSVLVRDGQLLVGEYLTILQINITVEGMTSKSTTHAMTPSPNIYLPTTTPVLPLKRTVAFHAEYDTDCSKLVPGIDISVVKAVMAYRFTQLNDICQSDCHKSSTYRENFYCTDNILRAFWPVDVPYLNSNSNIPTDLYVKIQKRVAAKDLSHFTLTFLFMEPPVRTPKLVCGNYLSLAVYVLDPRTNRWLTGSNTTKCS